jgi:RimJ/RimL family protein N-acetyltransferase
MNDFSIEEVRVDDAAPLLDFIVAATGETPFLRFFPDEINMSVGQEQDFIRKFILHENSRMLVARIEGKIAGTASIEGSPLRKFSHRGELGIAVLRDYWGRGLGRRLMHELLQWAMASPGLTKINLHVNIENEAAIQLYLACGFKIEGRLSRDFHYDDRYIDTLIMGIDV